MLAALVTAAALAAPPNHPVTLSGGVVEAVGPGAGGVLLAGRATAHVGRGIGIDVGGREGLMFGTGVVLGAVTAGVRWTPSRGPYVRGGFLHHHETPSAWARQTGHRVR